MAALAIACLLACPGLAQALDYRVRSGDTLWEIAERFGVTVAAIKRENGLRSNTIVVGQVLEIPVDAGDPPPAPAAERVYVVRAGDTLSLIAVRTGVLVRDIMRANRLSTHDIHPGQRLVLPGAQPEGDPDTPAADDPPLGRRVAPFQASEADVEVLARIIKGEMPQDGPFEGKVAVAAVVLNRIRSGRYGSTIPAVAHQPYQFSCYNPDVRRRLYYGPIPDEAWRAARAALDGWDPTDGSTFYFNPYLVRPGWARTLEFVRRIGSGPNETHDFYRDRGDRRRLGFTDVIE